MKKIFTIAFLLLTFSLSAQIAPYLEKGVSGSGLTLGYKTGKGFDGLYGKADYSFKGLFDINVCLYKGYFNENMVGLTNLDATEFYYSGSLSWWFLREKPAPNIDVNVALALGYEASNFKDFTYTNGEYNSCYDGWAGLNFNVGYNLPKNWTVQSILINEFGYGYDEYLESGTSQRNYFYGIVSYLGASLVKKTNNNNSFFFTILHSAATYGDSSYFFVSMGYVFSLNQKVL